MSLALLKILDKQTVEAIEKMQKMKDPEVKILTPKNYQYKNKRWEIIILMRDKKNDNTKS